MIKPPPYSWSRKRVLVTGATGFIGPWVVHALLEQGAAVAALIRDPHRPSELARSGDLDRIRVVQGAIEHFEILAEAIKNERIETVFHLASTNRNVGADFSPLPTFETNVRGTYNLLEACRVHGEQVSSIVVASSNEAYGKTPQARAEREPRHGPHPYEASKRCVELMCQSYAATYGLSISTLRCPNIYGGGDLNWQRIIPGTIRSLLHGERPVLRTDGSFTCSYLYVMDLVSAFLLLAETRGRGVTYGFPDANPLSVLEVVRQLISLSQRDDLTPRIHNTDPHEIATRHVMTMTDTVDQLGWRPAYSLEEGLWETLAWYREYFHYQPAEAGRIG